MDNAPNKDSMKGAAEFDEGGKDGEKSGLSLRS
jgi:hypothetical protein